MLQLLAKRFQVSLLLTICWLGSAVTSTTDQSPYSDSDWSDEVTWPVGDPRWCLERLWRREDPKDRTQMFQVLPGLGWDNLRNMETAPVVSYSYSHCRLTDDGEFLIPDNVFIIPLKRSHLQTFAELIDEWKELKSMTARTINMNPGFSIAGYSISGAFSREYAQVKGKQIEDKSATIRVQLRYHRYKSKLRPGFSLSPEFKAGLLGVATHLEMDQIERARYESQVLVRNFGTHVLTSVTAGAGLVKEDYVKRAYIDDNRENKADMLTMASGAFKKAFALEMGMGKSNTDKLAVDDRYLSNLTHSYTETLGGEVFLAGGMTAHDWAKDLDTNLVAMDRAGDPLYLLITQKSLPELPQTMVERLEKTIRNAVMLYYNMNVIPGCTDRTFAKFSVAANFDDGSCKTETQTGLALGGIYQSCEARGETLDKDPCLGVQKPNALTGDLTCPGGFTAVLLHEGDGPGVVEYKRKCGWCNLLGMCCHTEQVVGFAHFKTYWCAGQADGLRHETPGGAGSRQSTTQQDTGSSIKTAKPGTPKVHNNVKGGPAIRPGNPGNLKDLVKSAATKPGQRPATVLKERRAEAKLGYSFGGVYTATTENLVTNTRSCPEGFYPRRIFFNLRVCISDDYETASSLSIPFGGFFSCSMGNPLAAAQDNELTRKTDNKPLENFLLKAQSGPGNWPKKCPKGYSQHLAIEVSGCAIHYCAESGALRATNLPKVRIPPFSPEPPESAEGPELVFDQKSMTWITNPNISDGVEPAEDVPPEANSRVLQTSGPVPGTAPDTGTDSVAGQAPGTPVSNMVTGIQRASGPGSDRGHYVEMRPEVLAVIILVCLSLIAVTVALAVHMIRARGSLEKTMRSEATPLRLQSPRAVNLGYEQTEEIAVIDDNRPTNSYESASIAS